MIDQPNTPGQVNRICEKSRFGGFIGRFIRDRRGNMGPLIALMLVPLIGVIGVASETGSWFMVQRSMQNAADSAALAAATNAGANYVTEARSVTASYGFTNGANNTTVAVVNNDNTIPAVCGGACYKVTITRNIPIYLTRIVGYNGSVALGGDRAQTVSTLAIATPQVTPTSYCLLSLGSGDGFHINGGNNVNLHGCNVRANGDVTCNGSNSNGGANNIIYLNSNKKCSPSTKASAALADPYSAQAANIPPNPCGGAYPQEISNAVDAAHQLTGNVTWGALQTYCGDVMLTGNVNLTTASPGTVLVIYNGKLDMNGNTLLGLAGSGLTIIFSGTNGGGYSHIPTGGGTLNFAAPLAGSGTWSGYALYQDPALTSGVDMTAAGNSPTWDITGLIYLPKSNVQFSGAVNKATNGLSCFALVDSTFQSNGTGDILENQSQCAQAGVILPADGSIVRVSLVQ